MEAFTWTPRVPTSAFPARPSLSFADQMWNSSSLNGSRSWRTRCAFSKGQGASFKRLTRHMRTDDHCSARLWEATADSLASGVFTSSSPLTQPLYVELAVAAMLAAFPMIDEPARAGGLEMMPRAVRRGHGVYRGACRRPYDDRGDRRSRTRERPDAPSRVPTASRSHAGAVSLCGSAARRTKS